MQQKRNERKLVNNKILILEWCLCHWDQRGDKANEGGSGQKSGQNCSPDSRTREKSPKPRSLSSEMRSLSQTNQPRRQEISIYCPHRSRSFNPSWIKEWIKVKFKPESCRNLFSISLASKAGLSFQTLGDKCAVYQNLSKGPKVMAGVQVSTLYKLSITHVPSWQGIGGLWSANFGQGIGWLWSANFVVGVEHVGVLSYFCLLIRGSFTVVILKISAWCRLYFILFRLFVDFLGNYFLPTLPSKYGTF